MTYLTQKTERLHTRIMILWCILLCATLATLLLVLPTERQAEIYQNTLRVHVIANSDTSEDQALKLALKEHIYPYLQSLVSDAKDTKDATEQLMLHQSEIEEYVNNYLCDQPKKTSAVVEISPMYYPRRSSEGYTLPAGTYTSLRVILGEGQGQNWWGILYPNLSLYVSSDASAEAYLASSLPPPQSEDVTVRFRTLEWLAGWFSSH